MKAKQLAKLWGLLLEEFPEMKRTPGRASLHITDHVEFEFEQSGYQGEHFLAISYRLPANPKLDLLRTKLEGQGRSGMFVELASAASRGFMFPSGFSPELRFDFTGARGWFLTCNVKDEIGSSQLRGYLAIAVLLGDAYQHDLYTSASKELKAKSTNSGLGLDNFQRINRQFL